jgi:hypothetical protein
MTTRPPCLSADLAALTDAGAETVEVLEVDLDRARAVTWAIRFALVDNQTQPYLLGAPGAEALHRLLRDTANAAFDLGAIGLALATLIGFYFLFQVRALPRLLSAIAMLGAKLILLSSLIALGSPEINIPSSIAFAVTLLSNLVIGLWLLVRGDRSSQAKVVAQQA